MWEYTTSAHGLPIGAFFRGESARNAYRRNEDYSITKGSSTVVLGPVDIHRVARTDPTRCIIAEKLVSVLSERVAMRTWGKTRGNDLCIVSSRSRISLNLNF